MKRGLIFLLLICSKIGLAQTAALSTAVSDASETKKIKWNGDMRFRFQNECNVPGDSRLSQKIRVRLGLKAEIESTLKTEFRLATSKTNSSTNQTVGDSKDPGMVRRFIGLDLAYAEWSPLTQLKISGGRVPQIHDRPGGSQLLIDSDLALEGGSLQLKYDFSALLSLRSNWGSAWIRENYDAYYSEEQGDNMLNWGQLSLESKYNNIVLISGIGFFNYLGLQDMKVSEISTGGAARGNFLNTNGSYRYGYVTRQYYLEVKSKIAAANIGLFTEAIKNGEAAESGNASWTGFSLSQENWSSQIAYAYLETDPVPGVFTDSDFAGGTTDSNGWVFSFQWKVLKGLNLSATQYWTYKRTELGATRYDRTHVDVSASF